MSVPEYHADKTRLSYSQLEDFISDPALYEGRYITGEFPRDSSDAADIGTIIHDRLLCDGASAKVVIIPDSALTSNGQRRGKAWDAFREEHAGSFLIRRSEAAKIERVCRSVSEHAKAHSLLTMPGESEVSIRWQEKYTETPMRSLIDRLAAGFIVDIKTTAMETTPSAWSKVAYQRGYHRQAAIYSMAARQLLGVEEIGFCWIVVGTEPPYAVDAYVPDAAFIGLGHAEALAALDFFASCRESGLWRRKNWGRFVEISAPKWASL